jgi:hypothetical protein
MKKSYSFLTGILIVLILIQSVSAVAQSLSSHEPSAKVTIYRNLVRFAAGNAQQLRLELFDSEGIKVFDSGFVAGNSLDWLTQDLQGQPVDSNLFAYTLTVQGNGKAERVIQQGNIIIDRERRDLADAPFPDSASGKAEKGEVQPQAAGVFDVTAIGGSYNINTPLMGIGTSSPFTRLHVGSGATLPSTSGATLLVEDGATTSMVLKSTAGGELFLFQNNVGAIMGTVSNHTLSLRTNNQNRLVIDTSGRVGIGTATPTATLTVAGTIESTSGTLMGSVINASSQYNIGGNRVLSTAGGSNIFAGVGAGTGNTTGFGNAFFGTSAGLNNTTGNSNSFFGTQAGLANTIGLQNSFFGNSAGSRNTTGNGNAFFGNSAGYSNISGSNNAFFGLSAGYANTSGGGNAFYGSGAGSRNTTGGNNAFFGSFSGFFNLTGNYNAFFGSSAGNANTTGSENSFFGTSAGASNTTGSNNSFYGGASGVLNTTGSNNSFYGQSAGVFNTTGSDNSIFGADAGFSSSTGRDNAFFGKDAGFSTGSGSNNSFFGRSAGYANTTGQYNTYVGFEAGLQSTTGSGNAFFGEWAGRANTTGSSNVFIGPIAGETNVSGHSNTMIGVGADVASGNLSFATAIGADATVSTSDTVVLGRIADTVVVPGFLLLESLSLGGTSSVCRNVFKQVAGCSSSRRYKNQIQPFNSGLALINKLRPVSFNWVAGGERDLGLIAEEVADAEPLLVTHNDKGQVEGVKYDRINIALVNAVRELRAEKDEQISRLKAENAALSERLANLEKRLLNPAVQTQHAIRRSKTSGRHSN